MALSFTDQKAGSVTSQRRQQGSQCATLDSSKTDIWVGAD